MLKLKLMMAALILSGCMHGVETEERAPVICDETFSERRDLAVALVSDGGPESRRAGRILIQKLDGGCQDVN